MEWTEEKCLELISAYEKQVKEIRCVGRSGRQNGSRYQNMQKENNDIVCISMKRKGENEKKHGHRKR
jgi:hypothetical protein